MIKKTAKMQFFCVFFAIFNHILKGFDALVLFVPALTLINFEKLFLLKLGFCFKLLTIKKGLILFQAPFLNLIYFLNNVSISIELLKCSVSTFK